MKSGGSRCVAAVIRLRGGTTVVVPSQRPKVRATGCCVGVHFLRWVLALLTVCTRVFSRDVEGAAVAGTSPPLSKLLNLPAPSCIPSHQPQNRKQSRGLVQEHPRHCPFNLCSISGCCCCARSPASSCLGCACPPCLSDPPPPLVAR